MVKLIKLIRMLLHCTLYTFVTNTQLSRTVYKHTRYATECFTTVVKYTVRADCDVPRWTFSADTATIGSAVSPDLRGSARFSPSVTFVSWNNYRKINRRPKIRRINLNNSIPFTADQESGRPHVDDLRHSGSLGVVLVSDNIIRK
jgi:hypothetical protein